jgi:mRNA-degrading endonuclease RelE of RelBE toxin-antitoxin system
MAKIYKIVFRKSAEKQLLKLPKAVGVKTIDLIIEVIKIGHRQNIQVTEI